MKTEFVEKNIEQRLYFPFYNYEYSLDVSIQKKLLPQTVDLKSGLKEAYKWYKNNKEKVNRNPLIDYIDKEFAR